MSLTPLLFSLLRLSSLSPAFLSLLSSCLPPPSLYSSVLRLLSPFLPPSLPRPYAIHSSLSDPLFLPFLPPSPFHHPPLSPSSSFLPLPPILTYAACHTFRATVNTRGTKVFDKILQHGVSRAKLQIPSVCDYTRMQLPVPTSAPRFYTCNTSHSRPFMSLLLFVMSRRSLYHLYVCTYVYVNVGLINTLNDVLMVFVLCWCLL